MFQSRIALTIASSLMVAGSALVVGTGSAASAGTAARCPTSTLSVGQKIGDGQACSTLQSTDGRFILYADLQGLTIDQRLNPTGEPDSLSLETGATWTEQPLNGDSYRGLSLVLRPSGTLVLAMPSGVVMWSTGTAGSGAKYVALLPSGRLVLRTASGKQVWASNSGTYALGGGDTVAAGRRLISTRNYFSRQNGVLRNASYPTVVTMQADGNLVERCTYSSGISWQSNTHKPGSSLALLQNGALVVRGPHGHIFWSSPTAGWKRAYSVLGVHLYSRDGFGPIWDAPAREC